MFFGVESDKFIKFVNIYVYGDVFMVQVQVRVPKETVKELDMWVDQGKFRSRSDAIKTIISLYEERQKTRKFYDLLVKRSGEAKENSDILISVEDL